MNLALLKRSTLVGVDWGGEATANPAIVRELADLLINWIEKGELQVATVTERPASDFVQAYEDLLAGRIHGKLVLTR